MTFITAETQTAILNFNDKFHKQLDNGDGNYFSSGVAAWVLLALQGVGKPTPALEALLGMDPQEAFNVASGLIEVAPDGFALATEFWARNVSFANEWRTLLEGAIPVKDMPTQEEANLWTDENTLGLIKEFPVLITPEILVMFVNTIATKIDWDKEFDTTSTEVMTDAWGQDVMLQDKDTVLKFYRINERLFIAHTKTDAKRKVKVTSVIADSFQVGDHEMLNLAEEIVAGRHKPLTLEEFTTKYPNGSERVKFTRAEENKYTTVIPAWDAEVTHNLNQLKGFEDAVGEFLDKDQEDLEVDGVQKVVASYHKKGFEAAAVTVIMVGRAAAFTSQDFKHFRVEFSRSYSVVASTNNPYSSWYGLPLFSGTVRVASAVKG